MRVTATRRLGRFSRSGASAILAGVLALAGACAPAGSGRGPASLPASDHPLSGAPAPEFNLAALSGGATSLAGHSGRVVLLDFWATWCEPCRLSFPEYQALAGRYGDRVAVVGISEDDEAGGIGHFVKETGASFPVAWDGDKTVARSYQIKSMPTLFIIDQNGLVRFVHSGFRPGDEASIQAAIDSLLGT
jgi:cytochrome c biogenesis protein CcmG/thiol:disulfide interchange protein DsbE